jgi:Undecaprenyl-phosphate glucose phosphotransferase
MAGDVVGVILFGLVLSRFYAASPSHNYVHLWIGWVTFAVSWTTTAGLLGLYTKEMLVADFRTQMPLAARSGVLAFSCVLLVTFALEPVTELSRIWLLTWAAAAFTWVSIMRFFWVQYLGDVFGRGGYLERALVFAKSPGLARQLGEKIQRESGGRIRIASATELPKSLDHLSIAWIETAIRTDGVNRIIIAGLGDAVAEAQLLLDRLKRLAVDVTLIPSLDGICAPALNAHRIGTLPAIDLSLRPLTTTQWALKRVEDLVVASIILLITLPVFVLVGIAIKLDSRGPILFGQTREGYNGCTFKLWKFRSMYDADRDERSLHQTSRNDPRVTRVGRILRRLSIDELPQLLNVLRGDMSIVGPRPHALGMTSVGVPMCEVVEDYPARHRLKPGMTGLAQISGCRGEIDSHDKLRRRVSLDCNYIDRWSLSLDLKIIVRTVALLISDPNAY